jgi:hypothetical protein
MHQPINGSLFEAVANSSSCHVILRSKISLSIFKHHRTAVHCINMDLTNKKAHSRKQCVSTVMHVNHQPGTAAPFLFLELGVL